MLNAFQGKLTLVTLQTQSNSTGARKKTDGLKVHQQPATKKRLATATRDQTCSTDQSNSHPSDRWTFFSKQSARLNTHTEIGDENLQSLAAA